MTDTAVDQTYQDVMTVDPPAADTPLQQATRDSVKGDAPQVSPEDGWARTRG